MAPKPATRKHNFSMVMTEEERAHLEALAEADHRSAADWVRVAIATAYAERFGTKRAKPKK